MTPRSPNYLPSEEARTEITFERGKLDWNFLVLRTSYLSMMTLRSTLAI